LLFSLLIFEMLLSKVSIYCKSLAFAIPSIVKFSLARIFLFIKY